MTLTKHLLMCAVVFSIAVIGNSAHAGSGDAALTNAALSCGDPGDPAIYIDCGNGTVTDNRTGLTWLKNVGCLTMGTGGPSFAKLTWDRATIEAHNLSDGMCGLTDGSTAGDWRMPTHEEWIEMVKDAIVPGPLPFPCLDPALTNAAGDKCHNVDPIFTNFCGFGDNGDHYWSTTSVTGIVNTHVKLMDIYDGDETHTASKGSNQCVWPVRLTQGPGG